MFNFKFKLDAAIAIQRAYVSRSSRATLAVVMRACALDKLDQQYTHEAQEFTGTASRARVGR